LENGAKAPKALKSEAKWPFLTKAALFPGPFDVSNVALDVSNAALEVSNAALGVSNVAFEVSNAAFGIFPATDKPPPMPARNAARAPAFMPALSHSLFPKSRTALGTIKRKGTAGALCAENRQTVGATLIGGDKRKWPTRGQEEFTNICAAARQESTTKEAVCGIGSGEVCRIMEVRLLP
jgi:hypothetical protein